ncbi:MAG: IS3 family transposase [Atopobiaceae bacterium]|jgi:hypothetical protein|nr:IS3 family transposase [Atopobiaceae bacterium]
MEDCGATADDLLALGNMATELQTLPGAVRMEAGGEPFAFELCDESWDDARGRVELLTHRCYYTGDDCDRHPVVGWQPALGGGATAAEGGAAVSAETEGAMSIFGWMDANDDDIPDNMLYYDLCTGGKAAKAAAARKKNAVASPADGASGSTGAGTGGRLNEGDHPTVHSDRGGYYRCRGWIGICDENGLARSMPGKGCSLDSARRGGSFGRLKTEFIHGCGWAGAALEEFMDMLDACLRWYRDVRIKGDLDYRSPMQYRRDLGLLAA